MIHIQLDDEGKTVYVTAGEKLETEDYQRLTPELEKLIKERGKLKLLFDMSGVNVDPGALWRDLKFDVQHLTDFEKVAIVGDAHWQEAVTKAGNPFTSAEVKFFGAAEKDVAVSWVARR